MGNSFSQIDGFASSLGEGAFGKEEKPYCQGPHL